MILTVLLCCSATLISTVIHITRRKSKRVKTITNADEAHLILKSPNFTRYQTNAWLISTLGIVNPFTVASESLLKAFKGKVITTLSHWSSEQTYDELVSLITARINHHLSLLQAQNAELPLSKLVKQVTLDAFLAGILHVTANEDLLTELPDLIIHLWKHRDDQVAQRRLRELFSTNADRFSQSEFWQQLQAVLSNHSDVIAKAAKNDFDEKIANPLNIIVPGWETMWRLVFYALLELLRRPDLFEELRRQPHTQPPSHGHGALLWCILKETLRLYPPTKNIYRTNSETGQEVCISVQCIHRDENVWGSDALSFRPERFHQDLTSEQRQHYLPFSVSCPARHKFAYTFAGAIVEQILQRCPTLTLSARCSLPPTTQPLDMTRNSYNELLITA